MLERLIVGHMQRISQKDEDGFYERQARVAYAITLLKREFEARRQLIVNWQKAVEEVEQYLHSHRDTISWTSDNDEEVATRTAEFVHRCFYIFREAPLEEKDDTRKS